VTFVNGNVTQFHPSTSFEEKEICMHTLIKSMSRQELLFEQIPALAISLFIAEIFYKFHSFTLECLAFLATWYFFDAVIGTIQRYLSRKG